MGPCMNPVSLKSGPWVRPYSDNVKMELELRWTGTPQRALSTVPAERTEVPEGCHLSTWYNCFWSKVRNHPIGLTSKTLTLQEDYLPSESPKSPPKCKLLHSPNSTCDMSKLHFTTSWLEAQTRVSPRHSSSSFILGGMTLPQ